MMDGLSREHMDYLRPNMRPKTSLLRPSARTGTGGTSASSSRDGVFLPPRMARLVRDLRLRSCSALTLGALATVSCDEREAPSTAAWCGILLLRLFFIMR